MTCCSKSKSTPRASVEGLLDAAGALLAAAAVAGFLGSFWWGFELASHFRVQTGCALIVLAILAAGRRQWWRLALRGALASANAAVVLLPLLPDSPPTTTPVATVRIAVLNVHAANQRFDLTRQFLAAANADVILLLEVTDRWIQQLSALQTDYPHAIVEPRDDDFGLALFSRWPLAKPQVVDLGDASVPSVSTEVVLTNGATLHVLGTHPVPPAGPTGARHRNAQLAAIAHCSRQQTGPRVVLGDLNTTPWSPFFRRLLGEADLKDTSCGRGVFPTWPRAFWPLRIPIDHALVSPDVLVLAKRTGPSVGSDHLPILVELGVSAHPSRGVPAQPARPLHDTPPAAY